MPSSKRSRKASTSSGCCRRRRTRGWPCHDGKRVFAHGCQRVAGLAATAGTCRGNIHLCFGQPCQHGLALDAHLAEVQHLQAPAFPGRLSSTSGKAFRPSRRRWFGAFSGVTALHGLGKTGGGCGKTHGVGQVSVPGRRPRSCSHRRGTAAGTPAPDGQERCSANAAWERGSLWPLTDRVSMFVA